VKKTVRTKSKPPPLFKSYYYIFFCLVCVFSLWSVSASAEGMGNDAQQSSDEKILKLSLSDAIRLALKNNKRVISSYLDRVSDKFDLEEAEAEFMPTVDLSAAIDHAGERSESNADDSSGDFTSKSTSGEVTTSISQKIPTGADISFSWSYNDKDTDRRENDPTRSESDGNDFSVSLSQPLLKGGGIDLNLVSLRTARINEQQKQLSLKSSLIDTVTATISSYRSLLLNHQQTKLSKNSLERSKVNLETNKLLVETGRMAENELIYAQSDIANQEFSYHQTLEELDESRLVLIAILEIDKQIRIIPDENIEINPIKPDLKTCTEIAFKNNPSYLSTLLEKKLQDMNMMKAENNMLWDLSLDASYSSSLSDDEYRGSNTTNSSKDKSWDVGLNLNIPLYGDYDRKGQLLNAKIAMKQYEISLENTHDNIELVVKNAVRSVLSDLTQFKNAKNARTLSEKKLATEQEKLKLGRTTNFQVISVQSDLKLAENNEVISKISYLNALTQLDHVIGTTLETWHIKFERERPDVEKMIK
jgi:outer membrane protein